MLPIQILVSFFIFPLQPNPDNTSAPQATEILVKYNLLDQKREEKKTYLVNYFVWISVTIFFWFTVRKQDMKKIVTITVIIGMISILICTYLLWRWIAKHKGKTLTK